MRVVDLNADVGEGFGEDEGLLRAITSANVACGFHAGDERLMRLTCAAAAASGVKIGAHVSYRDREGFGRRDLEVRAEVLGDDVAEQIVTLAECADAEGGDLTYVKPHGALYNRCVHDIETASAIGESVRSVNPELALLCLPGSAMAEASRAKGIVAVTEAFADRRYAPGGGLVPRTVAGSVLTAREAVSQAMGIASGLGVVAADGSRMPLSASSICVHSDTPGAAAVASLIRQRLAASGVRVAPFT